MGSSEVLVMMPLLVGFALQVLFTVWLRNWGRRVAAKHGGGRAWRWAARMPVAALAVGLLGAGVTSVSLVGVFFAVGGAAPSQKATLMSEGIARAMLATAVAVPASLLLYLASVVVFSVGSSRNPHPDRPG